MLCSHVLRHACVRRGNLVFYSSSRSRGFLSGAGLREGFDCSIRPAPSGAGRTTPSQPGHYPLIIPPMFTWELPPSRYQGISPWSSWHCCPTQMLCNWETVAISTRWWYFVSYLTPLSLQTLWRAILRISTRNIHEVIRPVQPTAGDDSSQTSILSLSRCYGGQYQGYHIAIYTRLCPVQPTAGDDSSQTSLLSLPKTLWRAILRKSYRNMHEVIRPVQPAAGYDSSQTSLFLSSPPGGANRDTVRQ